MISLFYPALNKEKIIENLKIILDNKIIGDGDVVKQFEKRIGEYLAGLYSGNAYKMVAVNSCTSALHLAYILAGIKEGDEVIVPVLTCTATNHPILWLKAKPVFADIQKDTLNIDPIDIEKKVTEKTKAIVVMHNGGLPCDMDEIIDIARRYNLKVIEDTAQGFSGEYKGKKLGTIGDFGCFSFQAIKLLTCGDGGMLYCKDKNDYYRAKKIKWYGIDRDRQTCRGSLVPSKFSKLFEQRAMTFDIEETGYKYNMNNISASIGLANFEKIYEWTKQRKEFTELYRNELSGVNFIRLLRNNIGNANWLFQILVENREKFQKKMADSGIETNMVQVRNDVYSIFGGKRLELKNMNELENSYCSLPMHNNLTKDNVYEICKIIKKY
jgi:dTDP-4-amino-4,6-dideoxygalactose transaminase